MQILKRLRYAMHVLIAVTMVVGLALSVGQGVGLIEGVSVSRLMFHPLYVVPIFVVGLALAPLLLKRSPISGNQASPNPDGKASVGYNVRALALIAFGLALVVLASLIVFLLGKDA